MDGELHIGRRDDGHAITPGPRTVKAAAAYAQKRLALGESPAEVMADLCSIGIPDDVAWDVVEGEHRDAMDEPRRAAGNRVLLWSIVFVGAILLTAVGYWTARHSSAGGRYVVFGGGILIGGLRLVQSIRDYYEGCRG